MLVDVKKIITTAWQKRELVFAFNTIDAETTLAIARGATEANKPVLFEVSEKTIRYLGMSTVVAFITSIVQDKSIKVPIGMHLDHGKSYEIVVQAIQAGFSSVMFDGSALPYKDNVRITKKVVQFAKRHGVIVQGEVGALQPEAGEAHLQAAQELMTDPKQALEFVRLTGVNSLAVAVGTLHGPMKIFHKLPKLDFERLKAIHNLCRLPLVLHGASGVPIADLKKARSLGVTVANIDTEIRMAYLNSWRNQLQKNKNEYDPRVLMMPVMEGIQTLVAKKIRLLK